MFKLFNKFSLLIMACLICVSCGDSNDKNSRIRIIHNSPDAPNVDVLLNNSRLLNSVPYLADSGYLEVDSGVQNLKVLVAGTDTVAIEADLDLSENTSYSILAINKVASIEPLVLVDQIHTPNDTSCAIRVVHGAPSAPKVDVYASAFGEDIMNLEPVLSDVEFKTASGYLNVPCGDYQFRVTLADTKTVAIDSGKVSLERGAYTALARDNKGGGAPFSLGLFTDGL
jgi:hypothetical protein